MILYRALSRQDLNSLENKGNIYCTLYSHFMNDVNRKLDEGKKMGKSYKQVYQKLSASEKACYNDYYACFGKDAKLDTSLDCVIGHVEGSKLKSNNSPWISTSTDFDYVATEYAIPQVGNYNIDSNRKIVSVIDIDDNQIYNTAEGINGLRDKINNFDFAIDLRNDKLNIYYDKSAIRPSQCNTELYGYSITYAIMRECIKEASIKGFAGYATKASEVLVHGLIKSNHIYTNLMPLHQDMIYGAQINKSKEELLTDCLIMNQLLDKHNPLMAALYLNNSNLTDYLQDNYNDIPGNDIEQKYSYLKQEKIKLLKELSKELKGYEIKRIVDDKVHAFTYSTVKNIKPRSKILRDILLIEMGGSVYKYDPESKQYIDDRGYSFTLKK